MPKHPKRLFRQCKEMGLPEPKFEEFGDGIKTTIFRAIGDKPFDPKNVPDDPKNGFNDPKKASDVPQNDPNDPKNDPKNDVNDPKMAPSVPKNDPKDVNDLDSSLSDHERRIIDLIKRDKKITQQTIAETLGISLKTVKRMTTTLQLKGLIERIGSRHGGRWKTRG